MSGICGLLRFDGASANISDVDRQLSAMVHRGPDRRRAISQGEAALGHALLRVTPEDTSDRQPLADLTAGLSLVADLRLDNRGEIAEALALAPADLVRRSDADLVLLAWRKWGIDCLPRLLGDFALAVWDHRAHTLTLARDPVGQRQLYFHLGAGLLAFATEIKGLWALPEVPRQLSKDVVALALAYGLNGWRDHTFYEGIEILPGGSSLTVSVDGARTGGRYWEPQPDPAMLGRSDADFMAAYREVLGAAVTCRLRARQAPALLFSGGFDSTAIAALAGPTLQENGRRLTAVTSVLPDGYSGAERDARIWTEAARRHMPYLDLHFLPAPEGTELESVDAGLTISDGLPAFPHAAQSVLVQAASARGARVLMDGEGGDYTLNPRGYFYLGYLLRSGRLGTFLREWRAHCRVHDESPLLAFRREVAPTLLPRSFVRAWWRRPGGGMPDWMRTLVRPDALARARQVEAHATVQDPHGPPLRFAPALVCQRAIETIRRLPLVQRSNLAAHHGVDITRPFHDRRVVELALAVPPDLQVRDGRARYLARASLRHLYPPELTGRGRDNDAIFPDYISRHRDAADRLRDEARRLANSPLVDELIDTDRVCALFAMPEDVRASDQAIHMAMRGVLFGRFIEWFEGANR